METALAILMTLGIYVGIPVVIGLAIGGAFIVADRRVRKTRRAGALEEAKTATEKQRKERVTIG